MIWLGIIIGLLLNPAKQRIVEKVKEVYVEKFSEKAQFLNPVTDQEKFDNADDISDLLE